MSFNNNNNNKKNHSDNGKGSERRKSNFDSKKRGNREKFLGITSRIVSTIGKDRRRREVINYSKL